MTILILAIMLLANIIILMQVRSKIRLKKEILEKNIFIAKLRTEMGRLNWLNKRMNAEFNMFIASCEEKGFISAKDEDVIKIKNKIIKFPVDGDVS